MVKKDITKNYLNLLKVIATLFVICMHVISKAIPNYNQGTLTYNVLVFIDILLRSSVPLFILISGNLLLNKKYTVKQVLFKLIKYYLFFLIFNSLYMLMDGVVINKVAIDSSFIKNIFIDSITFKSIYQMWYFKILLLTYASIPLFQYIISKNNKILDTATLVVLLLLFQIIPWFIPVFYANYTYLLVFLTYFYLGYYLMKYTFKYENIVLFVLFIISYVFTYTKTIALDHDYYYMNFIMFNVMFISIFIFKISILIDKYLKNDKVNKLLSYLSKYSFAVFLLHGLVIGLLSNMNIINIYNYDNLLLILLNTFIVYNVTLLISISLKKLFKEL